MRVHPGVLAATPLSDANAFGGVRFWDALAGRLQSALPASLAWRRAEATNRAHDRMLTLAGLYIVSATDCETARVSAMLNDARLRVPVDPTTAIASMRLGVPPPPTKTPTAPARHGLTCNRRRALARSWPRLSRSIASST
ncbi:MAG: hypothetical protein R3C16_04385 [Hyphomonadaceae bacterium]